ARDLHPRAALGAAEDLAAGALRARRLALRLLRLDRRPADARPRRPAEPRRRLGVGERRHLLRPVQPAEGEPPAGGGRPRPPPPAPAAAARALHPARRADDPRRLEAVPPRAGRLTSLDREAERLPFAPRAGIEPAFTAGERQPAQDDAGADARAAVGDGLAGRELRLRLVPRRVAGAGDPAGHAVDRIRLAAKASWNPGVDDHELAQPPLELGGVDRVALARL